MPDRLFSEPNLAALYDLFCPFDDRADFRFYLPQVMASSSVLDVGCGTGALLHSAREEGHRGYLCGVDPAPGMLACARSRQDIDWLDGDLLTIDPGRRFDLVVMTGHAFQVLTGDEEVLRTLVAVRALLSASGRFVFETRNLPDRAWERWTAEEVTTADGRTVRMEYTVHGPPQDRLLSFGHRFSCDDWPADETSQSTLRFWAVAELSGYLERSGLSINRQYGDWDLSPPTESSPEIITETTR